MGISRVITRRLILNSVNLVSALLFSIPVCQFKLASLLNSRIKSKEGCSVCCGQLCKFVYESYHNNSPAFPVPDKRILALLRRRKSVYKYFYGAGKVFLNTSQASPAPERYQTSIYVSGAAEVFKYTSPAPQKPGKYLKTLFRRRRSIYSNFSGAGEVLIYTYLAPERPEKPEKYLYAPL